MKTFTTEEALVIFNMAPNLEEPMIDWLLSLDQDIGFTSSLVSGHSARHEGLTPAEQVSGRRRRLQIEIQMQASHTDAFLADAGRNFGTADVHYWVLPVLSCGRLNSSAKNRQ